MDIIEKIINKCDEYEEETIYLRRKIHSKFGTTIEIVDNTIKTEEQELVEDLIQIVTVFSCRLQGKRANKSKKLIKELVEIDD